LSDGTGGYLYGDLGFKTYVDASSNPVPDPGSTLLLLGVGLAGLRVWKKRLG
jgi:hypothetical protein